MTNCIVQSSRRMTWTFVLAAMWITPKVSLGQVVQLPSYRDFSVSGSAWVPDGGTVALGGMSYSATTAHSRGIGPYGSRAIGGIAGGASLSATVHIIDLEALDEALLADTRRMPAAPSTAKAAATSSQLSGTAPGGQPATGPLAPQARNRDRDRTTSGKGLLNHEKEMHSRKVTTDHWARILSSDGPAPTTVDPTLTDANIRYFLHMGQEAEHAGRVLAAGVYYRMAMDAMSPQLKQRYEAALTRQASEAEQKRSGQLKATAGVKF